MLPIVDIKEYKCKYNANDKLQCIIIEYSAILFALIKIYVHGKLILFIYLFFSEACLLISLIHITKFGCYVFHLFCIMCFSKHVHHVAK